MAEENPRIEINDFTKPIVNSRIQYLEENDNKIKGRKGLLFGSFINEKERVKKAIEDNSWMMGNSLIKTKIETKKTDVNMLKSQSVSPNKTNKVFYPTGCYQPQMRFKPRTDLERVYDSINLNYFGRADQEVINRQLKSLDLINSKPALYDSLPGNSSILVKSPGKESEGNSVKLPDHLSPETKKEESKAHKKMKKSKIKIYYRRPLNIESKKIMNDFHYKTHFKAVESIALYPNQINVFSNFPKKKEKENNNSKRDSDRLFSIDFEEEEKNQLNPIQFIESGKFSPYINNRFFYFSRNPTLKRNFSQTDMDKLKTLEKIAFNQDNNELCAKGMKPQSLRGQDEDLKKDEYKIKIGNEVFYMNNQMEIIAKKILNKCNVYHSKNKNSNHQLKAGEGKLMMTNGMSIKNFLSRYKLS